MNTPRNIDVERLLIKIVGRDGAREAMDRINRRLRRQAKVDRLLAPWFRLRQVLRRVLGRRGEG